MSGTATTDVSENGDIAKVIDVLMDHYSINWMKWVTQVSEKPRTRQFMNIRCICEF